MASRQLTKEQAKEDIKKLFKEFSTYTKEELDNKSENQIKSEFIDPLFQALGWDMRKDAEREERNRNIIKFKEIKEEKDLYHYDFVKIEQSKFFGKNDNRFIANVGNSKFEIIKKMEVVK